MYFHISEVAELKTKDAHSLETKARVRAPLVVVDAVDKMRQMTSFGK